MPQTALRQTARNILFTMIFYITVSGKGFRIPVSYTHLVVTLFMAIESSFIPFPSEVVVPPAAWKAMDPDSCLLYTSHSAKSRHTWVVPSDNQFLINQLVKLTLAECAVAVTLLRVFVCLSTVSDILSSMLSTIWPYSKHLLEKT